MFVSGEADFANLVFSFFTYLVAVPSAIKVFNWVATLYKGSIWAAPPFLYALCFIFTFSIGGVSGLTQGALGPNVHIHDTYFVVAHIHYVVFGGTGFGLLAAIHYWFPKMFGRMYNLKNAALGCLVYFIGFNVLYFPKYILGWQGMPRRYYDYLPRYATLQFISTVGSWILVAGLALILATLISALRRGPQAEANPWGGATLEWQIPSPPPAENFKRIPTVTTGPYQFPGREGAHG
jgi:cytochrome c oxidase subunit 1